MRMTHKSWLGSTVALLVTVLSGAGVYLWIQQSAERKLVATAPLDTGCDLQQGPCGSTFPDGGVVTLEIAPRPIKGLKQLRLSVMVDGFSPSSMEVDFRGLGMHMGYNRPKLQREAAGHFSGNAILSVCTLDRMQWEVTVLADTEEGVMAAPFRFEIQAR